VNISDFVTRNAEETPGRVAVICGDDGREFTWDKLNRLVNQFGNALIDIGIQKGDRVGLYVHNSPEFIIAYFGITKIGAVALPFNILFKAGEIGYILNDARAKAIFGASQEVKENLMPILNEMPSIEKVIVLGKPVEGTVDFNTFISGKSDKLETVDCAEDDLASMLYTSGTTGRPKGVMLTHGNLIANGNANGHEILANDQDLFFTGTPFCHIFFVTTILGPFSVGAGVLTASRFNPEKALELMSRYRVTHFAGVPTMYIFMLNVFSPEKYDLSAWRFGQSAGYSMPVEHIKRIEETFQIGLCEFYGATETSATASYNRLGHGKPGSVGRVPRGWSCKIVDDSYNELPVGEVGEILVKGPGVFKGYWERPEATEEAFKDSYFCTGDLGKLDEDGYLYIVDRKKDLILNGGYNVYPREVEEILYQNNKILECAVIGEKDPDRGEVPIAFVVLKEGEQLTESELIDFCKKNMASYKVPRRIKFIDEMPKSATGKLLKRMLK